MLRIALNPIQISRPLQSALAVLLLCVTAHARAAQVSAADLEKQLVQYKSLQGLEAQFHQVKTLKGLKLELKSSGKFRLEKEAGKSVIEWEVKEPSYLKLRISENRLELFEKKDGKPKPVVENQEMQARILRPLYAWLSMNGALIAEHYDIFTAGKDEFSLVPKDRSAPVKSLTLHLDSKKLVSRVTLEESSGDELRISFSGTKTNP